MATPRSSQFDSLLAILVDGARADVIAELIDKGELPTLKRYFVDAGGFRTATSVFPTVSGPAHLPFLTGAHPGTANLPGIRWAERPRRPKLPLGTTRSYMAPGRAAKLERDVPATVTTLFQHVDGLADVNTWFVRGCPDRARITRWSKPLAFVRSFLTRDWLSSDDQAERGVLAAWEQGFPSAFAVFPSVDEMGHRFGPQTEESYAAYRRFDRSLAVLIGRLAMMGRLERTLIVISADHGQTATHTHLELSALVEEIYPRALSYPKLWRHRLNADAAVMVSGNAMANIYLRSDHGWSTGLDFGEPQSRPARLVQRLALHEGIEHVIYRSGQGPTPGSTPQRDLHGNVAGYDVVGKLGHATITRLSPASPNGEPRIGYRAHWGDPFGYGPLPAEMTRSQVAAATRDGEFPDAPWQIAELFRSPRAGDVIVNAANGFDLRARFEYQPHNGSHGGLRRDHMLVPALVNARWGVEAKTPLVPALRTVDLFPSILAALGLPVAAGLDGQVVPIVRD